MKFFLPLFYVIFLIMPKDDCVLKKEMIRLIINDNSIAVFFKNKNEISIYDGTGCFEKGFKLDGINIKPVTKKTKGALTILSYQNSGHCASIELQLFSENTIYHAEFDVLGEQNK